MIAVILHNQFIGYGKLKEDLRVIYEFRLDHLIPNGVDIAKLREEIGDRPCIFTFKGEFEQDLSLLDLKPTYVDLDYKIKCPLPKGIKRIASFHDFEKTGDIDAQYEIMKETPADLYKICTQANSTLDSLRMLKWVQKTKQLGLCMGECGDITRILGPVFEAPFVYASESGILLRALPPNPRQGRDALGTPGNSLKQVSYHELLSIYRYHELNPSTKIFGLIGDPITFSQGHHFHNEVFKKKKLNAIYVKMKLKQDELDEFLKLYFDLFSGLSVTMPLKNSFGLKPVNTIFDRFRSVVPQGATQDRARSLLNIDEHAKQGATQCDNTYETINTDAPAALKLLGDIKNKKVLILGKGGVAKCFDFKFDHWQPGSDLSPYDVIINATPIGMPGVVSKYEIDYTGLKPTQIVLEFVSAVEDTPLVLAAKKAGCRIILGKELFLEQAKLQSELFVKYAILRKN